MNHSASPSHLHDPQTDAEPMGQVIAPATVRLERLLPGTPERLWSYLVESDQRALWLAGGPMEPREGGRYTLHFRHDDLSPTVEPTPSATELCTDGEIGEHGGTVLEWQPPRRLVLSWPEPAGAPPSQVVFELAPAEGGRVRLTITHSRLASRSSMLSVSGGWHTHIGVLVDRLAGRTPRPFWSSFLRMKQAYEPAVEAAWR